MPIDVSISENIETPIPLDELETTLQAFLHHLGFEHQQLIVCLSNNDEIQELNEQFRNKDRPTDVLSWSYYEEDPESLVLGEIMVSMDYVTQGAIDNGWSEKTELLRLLAHGVAHVAGYDHEISPEEERKMLWVEVALLDSVGLKNIYPSIS